MSIIRFMPIAAVVLFCLPRAHGQSESAPSSEAKVDVPIRQIELFASGVGLFQRRGTVQGDAELELSFPADDINDLLKSMVLRDLDGGQVAAVTYTSHDPLSRRLQSFAVNLSDNTSLADLLREQLRGERVELSGVATATGRIVGVETKQTIVGTGDDRQVVEEEVITLYTDEGLRTVPLSDVRRLSFLNPELDREFQEALEVLATANDTDTKEMSLRFRGEGEREVLIGYVLETPVWKTTYRLVLGEDEKPLLQGWAIVENTSDTDWSDVRLALVSGRPISFEMLLYQPVYAPRPVLEPELYAAVSPPKHEQALGDRLAAEPAAPQMRAMRESGGEAVGDARMRALGRQADAGFAFGEGIAAQAEGAEIGELFRYVIDHPVTLPRQKSAMLPIVNSDVETEKLAVYDQSVHAKHPLDSVRLTNTTELYLMHGPMTIFDSGTYAGDARLDDLSPGNNQLLSYGVAVEVEVSTESKGHPRELIAAKVVNGTLVASRKLQKEVVYTVANRDDEARNVLIEHPKSPDWRLVEPESPTETTRDAYRFAVDVSASESGQLNVVEQRTTDEQVVLSNANVDQIQIYLEDAAVNEDVQEALQTVVEMKQKLSQITAERESLEKELQEISNQQARIRENMQRLSQSSELYARYVNTLSDQEDRIEELRTQLDQLQTQEKQQQQELNQYLADLDVGAGG